MYPRHNAPVSASLFLTMTATGYSVGDADRKQQKKSVRRQIIHLLPRVTAVLEHVTNVSK